MREIIIVALVERVKNGGMTIDQVPIPFKDEVQALLEEIPKEETEQTE